MSVQCGYHSSVHSIPRNSAKDGDKKEGNWDESFDATAAFLGPNLWDKTVPYNDDFKMEYMDLDEFFTENGIAVPNPNHEVAGSNRNHHQANHPHHHHPHHHNHQQQQPQHHNQQQHQQQQEQDHHHSPHHQPHPSHQTPSLPPTPVTPTPPQIAPPQPKPMPTPDSTSTPPTPPTSPFEKPVQIKEALATSPGQERFDPNNHTFSEDELKPQPMVKKSKKQLVPNDMKDEKYWARRKKNNMAAKRSRDARRIKENQIAMRASFLERENTTLRKEVEAVQRENSLLKEKLAKYERC